MEPRTIKWSTHDELSVCVAGGVDVYLCTGALKPNAIGGIPESLDSPPKLDSKI